MCLPASDTDAKPAAAQGTGSDMPTKAQLDAALAHADAHIEESLERLKALIRIKSISTDRAYDGEVQRAADWLRQRGLVDAK